MAGSAADREWVQRLWVAAMPPSWQLLPAGTAMLAEGLVAEAGTGPVGLAAADRAGSVPPRPLPASARDTKGGLAGVAHVDSYLQS